MDNLRERVEADLDVTLEGDWGLPVVLIDPATGITYDHKYADPPLDPPEDLVGQVLYDTRIENPETGGEMIVHKPVVTLRRSSLEVIPSRGWVCKIPLTPSYDAEKVTFLVERPAEDGGSIGFIRLYLMRAENPPT